MRVVKNVALFMKKWCFSLVLQRQTNKIVVSQLSCLWFALHERTRLTTIAILRSTFGGAAAFLISPHLVYESQLVLHPLYVHAGRALLACIFTLAYFPAEPPSPPSAAAQLLTAERFKTEPLIETLKRSIYDVLHCFYQVLLWEVL
jgi:hypothetical protein